MRRYTGGRAYGSRRIDMSRYGVDGEMSPVQAELSYQARRLQMRPVEWDGSRLWVTVGGERIEIATEADLARAAGRMNRA